MRAAVGRLAVLLRQIGREVDVGRIPADVRQVLAERVAGLEAQALREVLANRYLHAVVVVDAVESVLLQAARQVAQIRHAGGCVGRRIGGDAVDVSGEQLVVTIAVHTRARGIDVVVVIHLVDAARSHEANFQNVGRSEFVLDAEVVLAHQRRVQDVVERRIERRAGERLEIKPARQERQRAVLEGTLQAGDFVLNAGGIGVGAAFVDGMHQAVDADAIVEQADAATHHQALAHLPGEADAGSEIIQRHSILRGGFHRGIRERREAAVLCRLG